MAPQRNRKPTQPEVIVECWKQLDAECLGRRELEVVSNVLRERFGAAAASPAAIARTLADHGVRLSHSDVLDFDTSWRAHQLLEILPTDLETIDVAVVFIENIRSSTADGIDRLRQVRQIQEELELFAQSQIGSGRGRSVAGELALWLSVWLQNPAVFDDWLLLRRDSPEFLQKFG